MRTVAEIASFGRDPGLVAFLCTECGAADSILVYPANKNREVDHEQ
jgi:hypothetical protein